MPLNTLRSESEQHLAVLNLLVRAGAAFDIVSVGELYRVQRAGGKASQCTFAGVGKRRGEIAAALKDGIGAFIVESRQELEFIGNIATALQVRAPIALRVNPDVQGGGHAYISTGGKESKFGIGFQEAQDLYDWAFRRDSFDIRGVHMHIGSQITDAEVFGAAIDKVLPFVEKLKKEFSIEFFSIGGGLGIVYEDALASGRPEWWKRNKDMLTVETYAAAVCSRLNQLGLEIHIEPGRFLVGPAGVLLCRVELIKESAGGKKFVVLNAGMNDLIRPALYQGYHEIVPVIGANPQDAVETVDVVGPVCETGDFFALARKIPPLRKDDLVAVMSVGAYGFCMASTYNSRPLPAEIMVSGNRAQVVRRRQDIRDLVEGESIWQDGQ